jgi:hypothetical protein
MPAQEAYQKRPEHKPDPNKFDLKTHHFDSRGRLFKLNHYRLHIKDGVSYFERPVNSGNLYWENNEAAGRVETVMNAEGKITGKKFDFKAPHKTWTAPLTGDEKVHYENESLKARNEELIAELESIKADGAKKTVKPAAVAAVEAKVEVK